MSTIFKKHRLNLKKMRIIELDKHEAEFLFWQTNSEEMTMDCIFCKIASGEMSSSKVYENDYVFAFDDIRPLAPVHVLIIPKKHIENAAALTPQDADIMAAMFNAAIEAASIKGIKENGFRIITNSGINSGQEIYHFHLHLLGGKQLGPLLTH